MKPICYSGTYTYNNNFINIGVLPLCGTSYHTIKIKKYYNENKKLSYYISLDFIA